MIWWEKAYEMARRERHDSYGFECFDLLSVAMIKKYWHCMALEDHVGEEIPLPAEYTLKEMNDIFCAGCMFDAFGVVYSGNWQKTNGIWYIPVEAVLHAPEEIFKRVYHLQH